MTEDTEINNAFNTLLSNHRRGAALDKVSNDLHEAVISSQRLQKQSKIVVTLTIKPTDHEQVDIDVQSKLTVPEDKMPTSRMYINEDGQLVPDDPKQMEFGVIKSVATPASVKSAG